MRGGHGRVTRSRRTLGKSFDRGLDVGEPEQVGAVRAGELVGDGYLATFGATYYCSAAASKHLSGLGGGQE